jgi:hypothetical protein
MAVVALTIDASHGGLLSYHSCGLILIHILIDHDHQHETRTRRFDIDVQTHKKIVIDFRPYVPICFRSDEKAGHLKLKMDHSKFKCEKAFTSEMEFS